MRAVRALPLWVAFLAIHLVVAAMGWVYPSQPMGDVVLVYQPWTASALAGGPVVGIDESWVYPQAALLPMLLTGVIAGPLTPLLGTYDAYLIAWAVLVTVLDAVAFGILLGRAHSRRRRVAAAFWCAALLLLGPIALYRIDAVTVPLAVVAGLWLSTRPIVAGTLLAVGAWIKIWPGALLVAAVLSVRSRMRVLGAAVAVSAGVVAVLLLLGAGPHVFGFLGQQEGRGLQIEAVAATPFLWLAAAGAARIEYSLDILTFQISAPGADAVSAVLTPVMVTVVAAVTAIGAVKAARGAAVDRLFPALALSLVAALIVTNKVGSPQFQTWLLAPVVLWILVDATRSRLPAAVVLGLCALTCLVYPVGYDALLRAEVLPIGVLTVRNLLLVVLLVIAIRALIRVPATARPSLRPSTETRK